VGIAPAELGPVQAKAPETTGRSPKNLLAATVGDQLKLRDGAKAKVFTASNKDRSAILLGGQRGDAAYWDENGKFVTSRHYRAALPAWVAAFNAEKRAEAAFGRVWERVLAPAVYETVQGPDDAAGETVDFGFTRVFPKTVNGGAAAVTPKFFTAYENSPFSTEALGEFVQRAVVEEQLGRHEGTDLLGVSFSQIDAIGHSYGPASHEVMDSMLRLDRVLAALFDRIDREVGLARCVIVLTADHGVAPLPEGSKDGRGGRIKIAELDAAVKQALDAKFGALPKGETWFARDNLAYHLRPAALAARSASAKDAGVVVKTALMATPVVAEAYTREEILAAEPVGESVLALVRRSYHAERGRDVILVPKPYFMVKTSSGSTHSTPYDYDTHVALVFFGAGVPQGVQEGRVGIDDLAPTLAPLLGVKAPPLAKGRKLF
jgi:predicted AlkP superfamily pyrophosphatase or phosphodiesterase